MPTEDILQEHSRLIHRVVMECNDPGSVPDMEFALQQAEDNGWIKLVTTIRFIMSGNRNPGVLDGLDDEDHQIISAVLNGLEDPATLPTLKTDFNSPVIASGIAGLLNATLSGNVQAQQVLNSMTDEMIQGGDDLGAVASRLRPIVEGERDPEKICAGLSDYGRNLLFEILVELKKFEAHQATEGG